MLLVAFLAPREEVHTVLPDWVVYRSTLPSLEDQDQDRERAGETKKEIDEY
jgi:hypothetical protein